MFLRVLLALLFCGPAAAQEISNLPAGTSLVGPEEIPMVQSGVTVKMTVQDIKTFTDTGLTGSFQGLDADLTSIAALTTTAAGRSCLTAVDGGVDELFGWDDSDSACETLGLSDMLTEASPASGDFILIYGAEGDLRKVDWSALPSGGTLGDADYGDITVSSTGTVWNIDQDVSISGSTPTPTVVGTSAGAAGPVLTLQHDSATPALNDITTSIQTKAGTDDEVVGRIEYRLTDGSTTTEDGFWDIYTDVAGTDVLQASLGGNSATFGAGAFTTMTFDAGATDPVLTFGSATLAVTGVTTLSQTASLPVFTLSASSASALGPVMNCQHDSATPAAADVTCSIRTQAGTDDETVGRIEYYLLDGSTTTEDGMWQFYADVAGTDTHSMSVGKSVVIGRLGENNVDGVPFTYLHSNPSIPYLQVAGTAMNQAAIGVTMARADVNGPLIMMGKMRGTTGDYSIVSSGDIMGELIYLGADGTNLEQGANIFASVDGTPGADDMPGQIGFQVTADGAFAPTTRMRLNNQGNFIIGRRTEDGASYFSPMKGWFGTSTTPNFQVIGENADDGRLAVFTSVASASGAEVLLGKSRSGLVGSNELGYTIVNDGDVVGLIGFQGADGVDLTGGADIFGIVDGTPGSNDMPMSMVLRTTPDGSSSSIQRIRISTNGGVVIGNGNTAAAVGRGTLVISDATPVSGAGGQLMIAEDTDNGANYKGLRAPASITANTDCTLINQTPAFIPYGCLGSTQATTTVDGATTFAVTESQIILACTGAETINTITGGVTGMRLLIMNGDTDCTIADDDDATASDAINLTGTTTNDVGSTAKVIELIYTGGHWAQISESANG